MKNRNPGSDHCAPAPARKALSEKENAMGVAANKNQEGRSARCRKLGARYEALAKEVSVVNLRQSGVSRHESQEKYTNRGLPGDTACEKPYKKTEL